MDIFDIAKKYARKMEYLAMVHDGSEGTLANGYWTCSVIGADGIRELLFSRQKGLESFIKMLKTETIQLKLFNP